MTNTYDEKMRRQNQILLTIDSKTQTREKKKDVRICSTCKLPFRAISDIGEMEFCSKSCEYRGRI